MAESSNHRAIVSLRDYVDTRMEAVEATMRATERAMDIRLETMNEFRAQINAERGEYIQRSHLEAMRAEHDAVHKSMDNDIRSLRESRSEVHGKASVSAVYFTALCVVVSLLLSVAAFVRSLY